MSGICQCGCGMPSSKKTPYFRHSIAHIFPKRIFKSIIFHPLNWVERAFFGGCHTNMDERSIERWHLMADWPVIVVRFHILEKELTPMEKTYKFYHLLKREVELHPI